MLQIEITLTGLFPCFVKSDRLSALPMGMRLPESASLNNNRAVWQAWKLILPASSRIDRRPLHQESKAARGRDTAEALLGGGAGSARQEQGAEEECRAEGAGQGRCGSRSTERHRRGHTEEASNGCSCSSGMGRNGYGKAQSCSQPLPAGQKLWPSRRSGRRAPKAAHVAALPHGTHTPS